MKNKVLIKKIMFVVICLIITLNILSVKTYAIVEPTAEFYVNDYAKLLSLDTKEYIINVNKELYSKTGAQIVVVTVPNLEGSTLETYATALFRKFGIGDKTKNNGVLLLLALQERQFRVEVGYGLEGVLTDGKTGRIQDNYIIPYLKENNWNDGIRNGFNAILSEVEKEYDVNVGGESAVGKNNSLEDDYYIDILIKKTGVYLIFITLLTIIVAVIIRYLYWNYKIEKSICLKISGVFFIIESILNHYFANFSIDSYMGILMIKGLIDIVLYYIFIVVIFAEDSYGIGGGSFGGGSSGWRRLIRRILKWWFIRRWWLIRWWRKLKKFLKSTSIFIKKVI